MTLQEIDSMKWLIDALDHLKQYQAYSEAMRKIGRGFTPSSPFSPNYLQGAIKAAIQTSLVKQETLTPRELNILAEMEPVVYNPEDGPLAKLKSLLTKIRREASSYDLGAKGLLHSKENIKIWAEQALKEFS